MSLAQSQVSYTVDEYLAQERESEERHEYLDGQIYAMAGESPEHGAICINIGGQLYNQLRGRPCQTFSKDMKVRSGPIPKMRHMTRGLYSYPDLLVACGELKFHDRHRDVLLNPAVIVEVLSPTTEAFDRGEKWTRYQTWLPELTDYLLVSQSKPQIEHYHRQASGEWLYSLVNELEKRVHLNLIKCSLQLADVYDRITFPIDEEDEEDEEEA
ncbi:MAG: Uma2 family endonuclease [Acidobacteriota bacterium]|nr:Uma2 family endonuclease [Acidobacteriota bacterium]